LGMLNPKSTKVFFEVWVIPLVNVVGTGGLVWFSLLGRQDGGEGGWGYFLNVDRKHVCSFGGNVGPKSGWLIAVWTRLAATMVRIVSATSKGIPFCPAIGPMKDPRMKIAHFYFFIITITKRVIVSRTTLTISMSFMRSFFKTCSNKSIPGMVNRSKLIKGVDINVFKNQTGNIKVEGCWLSWVEELDGLHLLWGNIKEWSGNMEVIRNTRFKVPEKGYQLIARRNYLLLAGFWEL